MVYGKHHEILHLYIQKQWLYSVMSELQKRTKTKPDITLSFRLIVQYFPIINRPCSVPFIFRAIYLPPLPVLCVLCLYKREWMTQADLSVKTAAPNHRWLPIDSRPYTSTSSGPSSAQWVTNLQVLNQTADKHAEGGEWAGRFGGGGCRWI